MGAIALRKTVKVKYVKCGKCDGGGSILALAEEGYIGVKCKDCKGFGKLLISLDTGEIVDM